MTMPRLIHHTWSRVSWPNMAFQLFARLPTLQTWLAVISGCSPNWRGHWFPFWQPWEHNVERNKGAEKPSRNASSNGRNDGLIVWSHKGPTLKGIRNWAPSGTQHFFLA
jgi:hypothetical protein